jgi:hypothetical protein
VAADEPSGPAGEKTPAKKLKKAPLRVFTASDSTLYLLGSRVREVRAASGCGNAGRTEAADLWLRERRRSLTIGYVVIIWRRSLRAGVGQMCR